MKFTFSQDIRLGEIVTALTVVGGVIGVWVNLNTEVAQIKESQRQQVVTNREMRQEFREVAVEIKGDIRELRQEVRTAQRGKMM